MAASINRKEVWMIFIYLFVLTVLEVVWAQIPGIGKSMVFSGLVIMAVVKAVLVAMFYMHLKHETKLIKWSVAIAMGVPAFYALVLITEAAWRMNG